MITGDSALNAVAIGAIVLAGAAFVGGIALGLFLPAARDRARTIAEPGDDAFDQAIDMVAGAAGPSDAEITRMVRDYKNRNDRG